MANPPQRVMVNPDGDRLKILVVEDETISRMMLERTLIRRGYAVVTATDGREGVEAFEREHPDIILMDVQMPVMNGYEATSAIKAMGEQFVPVIFLTASEDDAALKRCIDCGGDDFLTKPVNTIILQSKIEALLRIRQLTETVTMQRDELKIHQMRIDREHRVAERVFLSMIDREGVEALNVKRLISPMSVMNGDLLLVATGPSGELNILVGDFTGHGLAAAIGSPMVCDVFYAMVAKAFSISDIVLELSRKLELVLPTGLFFACCLMRMDREQRISIWNGGLPDVLVLGNDGSIRRRVKSSHLALGVVPVASQDTVPETFHLEIGERVFGFTDGVTESRNVDGEMYGEARMEKILQANSNPDDAFDALCQDLANFGQDTEQDDDITLVEIEQRELEQIGAEAGNERRVLRAPMVWSSHIELGPDALYAFDPLPLVMQILMEVQGLNDHRQALYTVLAELFSNAVDHGLLGLDSSLKETPQGFAEYYQKRRESLAALSEGYVRIECVHENDGEGGQLTIRVRDSGRGFDTNQSTRELDENSGRHGRGLALVRTLCEQLTYSDDGRCAEAVYRWQPS